MGLAATAAASTDVRAQDDGLQTEIGFVPLVGGDTDIGIGVGFLASVARLAPGREPYVWRVESAGFISFKSSNGFTSPYQDVFVLATVPGLANGRLRLELRPSFTRETNLRYYGIGNASSAPDDDVRARDFYRRIHPALGARARVKLVAGLDALVGLVYSENWIAFEPESRLAQDLAAGPEVLLGRLLVDRRFALLLPEVGLVLDRRDDEIAPSRGHFHQLKVRVSPSVGGHLPYDYVQLNLTTRFYFPLVVERLSLATRQVADFQFGNVPFFELGRFDESSALGGANGVRGIPADRYLGQIKLFGNIELRATLWHFTVRKSHYTMGLVGFFDGGRLWTDLSSPEQLDGVGVGLKYGVGGGIRIQKGQTFVVRADVAWSPDARPIAGYFLAGHIF